MNRLAPTPEDMRIFWVGDDMARIEARTTYCLECIARGEGIVSALDDMAQIIGYEAPLVDDNEKDIIDALMDNGAVLVKATAEARGGRRANDYSIWDRGYVVTTGRDPYEAYMALVVLEKAAEIQIKAAALGGTEPLTKSHAKRERRRFLKKYSAPGRKRRTIEVESNSGNKYNKEDNNSEVSELASEAISDNAALLVSDLKGRMELVDYGNKLVEKDLVQGTWGNISVRLDEEYMLTTPSGLDYDDCKPEDMVRVNIETLKAEDSLNDPTSEKSIHAEIYKARPDVGAIVHTHSKYCSLLAACRMPLEVREESLAKDVGELILVADYGESGSTTLAKNVVEALGKRKGCIMSHHGMVACGKDIEEALSIAMSMEEASRLLVNRKMDEMIK